MTIRWAPVVVGAAALVPFSARSDPGDLLATELAAGSVVEFSGGGDLSESERFATGLSAPTGICIGPGGHVYVAGTTTGGGGAITIIDDGGDFSGVEAFAESSGSLTGLWCDDATIVVGALLGAGQSAVIDATKGGQVLLTGDFLAIELPAPAGLVRDGAGTLWSANGNVYDLSVGFAFGEIAPYTTGRTIFAIEEHDGLLLGGDFAMPHVVDLTLGGDLSAMAPWAELPAVGKVDGLLDADEDGLYALAGEAIWDISGGGDFTLAAPFAWGLQTGQVGFHQMVRHVCSADVDCADADACNGSEQCTNNECLPADAPTDCDDDDPCTSDACDTNEGCAHVEIAGCCTNDSDCAFDELCAVDLRDCVPLEPVPGSSGEGASSSDSEADGSTSDDGTDPAAPEATSEGSSDDGAAAPAGDDACGCRRAGDAPRPLAVLLLVLIGLFTSRARCASSCPRGLAARDRPSCRRARS